MPESRRGNNVKSFLLLPLIPLALLLAACGQSPEATAPTTQPAHATASATAAPATSGAAAAAAAPADSGKAVTSENGQVTVHMTGDDKLQYNINSFTVHPGDKVHITLRNIGKMPKAAMSHDIVILKPGADYKKFAADVAAAGGATPDGDIPSSLLDQVIAHTKLAGPGEEVSTEFTAPAAGFYPFLCTFPGHFVTMHGVMIVK
jgi:azurin